MNSLLKDKARLALAIVFIFSAIITFLYGFFERQAGNDFNQIWMLGVIMLLGAMVHLQKIGKKPPKKNK